MATTEELLQTLEAAGEQSGPVFYEIDPVTRVINIPPEFLLGVESDENSSRVYFTCPKIVGDNVDLSALELRVNFENANGIRKHYVVNDVVDSTTISDNIVFSWKLSRDVTKYKGTVKFTICAVKKENNVISVEWNTIPTTGKVLEGLEVDNVVDNCISMIRGDTFITTLSIQDTIGNVYIPVQGDSIKFLMKKTLNDEILTLYKTIPIDTLKLIINPEDTNNLEVGTYIYDIRLTKSTGEVHTVIPNASFILCQEVD